VSLISLRIFEKICNGPNRILLGWGETADSWKKPEAKSLWHCPFKRRQNWCTDNVQSKYV
jgi:hypothetical protein